MLDHILNWSKFRICIYCSHNMMLFVIAFMRSMSLDEDPMTHFKFSKSNLRQ